MKKLLLTFLFIFQGLFLMAQGAGIGYMVDLGGNSWSPSAPNYYQSIQTTTHNGFVRFHNASGHNAIQIMGGYRTDSVHFENYSSFLGPDNATMMNYNTDAYLIRNAWKLAIINQMQYGRRPGRFMFSINTGLFFEQTLRGNRYSYNDGFSYILHNELNHNNLGFILGTEVRFKWFTIGCKYEKLMVDMLDHQFINSQELNLENSSELRGLKLNPGMWYFTMGFNLDFFEEPYKVDE